MNVPLLAKDPAMLTVPVGAVRDPERDMLLKPEVLEPLMLEFPLKSTVPEL